MKRLLLLVLLFQSIDSIAQEQDFSIINFVTNKCSGKVSFSIYLNEQLAGSINPKENLEYKIYSEGRISIALIINSYRLTRTIDVKKGNTYYFEVNNWRGKYEIIPEAIGKEYFAQNLNTIKAEENVSTPIGTLSKETLSKGPKSGTGFLLSESGLVVTNHHVIENGSKIMIKGINGDYTTAYSAKILADDKNNDLAILQIENKTITFEPIPYTVRNKGADTGEEIYVLGYPMITSMGEEVKLTTGVISAKTGYQGDITSYQVSAPVQGGNSGGPMFDKQGNLTGVINAKIHGAEGVTYAIKTNYLNTLIDLLSTTPVLNESNKLTGLSMQEQVKQLSNFVYIIEVNN